MATFIPLKSHTTDDRAGNHYVLHTLSYDPNVATSIDTAEGLVDAAVLYGTTGQSKPTLTVSQANQTVALAGGTAGSLVVVTRHVGNTSL
jgi:uncharacterized membrane protein YdcZ (DUF606 family)